MSRNSSSNKPGARSATLPRGGSKSKPKNASDASGLQANSRMHKINEILHRELAKLISVECKDPRLGMVTVTGVDVSKDLSNAKVFVTVLEVEKTEQSMQILNTAAGFFRSRLSQLVTLRKMPALRFIYDKSVLTGSRINSIFSKLENPENTADDN